MAVSIIAGLLFGAIGGMGVGGGIILIPALTIFLGFDQVGAQGVTLIAFLPMALAAIWQHARKNQMRWRSAFIMAIPGALGALAGAFIANWMDTGWLRILFACFLLLGGILGLVRAYRGYKEKKKQRQ